MMRSLKKRTFFLYEKKYLLIPFIFILTFLNLLLMKILAHFKSLSIQTCQWDCYWYTGIIERGYTLRPILSDPDRLAQANWAFFPLYPVLGSIIHKVTHLDALSSGLLVNIILWPLLIYTMYKDIQERGIEMNPLFFSCFAIIFPFNIWYTSQYTESLFSILLVLIFRSLRKDRIPLAAFGGFLISLSRPTGFISILFLSAWLFINELIIKRQTLSPKKITDTIQKNLFLVSAAGFGLSLYVLYLFHLTGDGFAFSHVEIAWDRHFSWLPLQVWHAIINKHLRKFAIFFFITVYVLYKMYRAHWKRESCLIGLLTFIAASTSLVSIERYALSNPFIIEFLACSLIRLSKNKQALILGGLFVIHIVFILLWYRGAGILI